MPRILAVDDDPAITRIINESLGELGMSVATAGTLAEARKKILGERFDLVIMDRVLPDGEGIMMCSFMRAGPVLRSTPLLVLSGKAEIDDKVLGLQLGADDYLAKPFALPELRARVENLLRRAARLNATGRVRIGFWRY
jgi:DNA-binding response OmpR family regulator